MKKIAQDQTLQLVPPLEALCKIKVFKQQFFG
jgi:hypothetical protein